MTKIKCCYCDKEICKHDEFYVINNKIYCSECVKEETITYFKVSNSIYDEGDIYKFYDRDDAIKVIDKNVNFIKSQIKSYEGSNEKWIKHLKDEIEEFQNMKKDIFGDDENVEM